MVKHFKINLNKAANRLDIYEQNKRRKSATMVAFYVIVVFLLIGISGYFTYTTQKEIDQKKEILANIEEQIEELEASDTYISRDDVYGLVDLVDMRVDWARRLLLLARSLPRDIAITELNYRSNYLTIKGISKVKKRQKDLDRVMEIIRDIQSREETQNMFAGLKFRSSNRISHNDQEVLNFEIGCPVN